MLNNKYLSPTEAPLATSVWTDKKEKKKENKPTQSLCGLWWSAFFAVSLGERESSKPGATTATNVPQQKQIEASPRSSCKTQLACCRDSHAASWRRVSDRENGLWGRQWRRQRRFIMTPVFRSCALGNIIGHWLGIWRRCRNLRTFCASIVAGGQGQAALRCTVAGKTYRNRPEIAPQKKKKSTTEMKHATHNNLSLATAACGHKEIKQQQRQLILPQCILVSFSAFGQFVAGCKTKTCRLHFRAKLYHRQRDEGS